MEAEAVVEGDIGVREFIQLDAKACTPAGGDSLKAIGNGFCVGLGVYEYYSAEEAITCYTISIFCFQVDHVFSSEAAADIAAAHIGIGVRLRRRQQQVGGIVIEVEDVVGPEGQGVVGTGGQVEVVAGVELDGLPVGIAAEEGEIGPEDEVGVPAWFGIDLVAAAVEQDVKRGAGR